MSSAANPRAPKPEDVGIAREPTGAIAADSLAAESLRDKGGFSENTNATAMSVKGNQSTLNTTDTSGATALPPAADSTEREKSDAQAQGADVKGVTGFKYPEGAGKAEFSGHHSHEGYAGGASKTAGQASSTSGATGASDFGASTISSSTGGPDASQIRSGGAATQGASSSGPGNDSATQNTSSSSSGASGDIGSGSSASGPAAGTGVRPQVDQAPNYAASVTGAAMPEGTFKPKGANLDDADKSDSIPKTKTFTGAIGTVNDPGRLAERDFIGRNDDPVAQLGGEQGTEGGQVRQQGKESQGGDKGKFGVLESERA